MSLLIVHIICLSFGQFASIISLPLCNTVGVMSDLFIKSQFHLIMAMSKSEYIALLQL